MAGTFPSRGVWRRPNLRPVDLLVFAAVLALLYGPLRLAPALNAPFLPKTAPSRCPPTRLTCRTTRSGRCCACHRADLVGTVHLRLRHRGRAAEYGKHQLTAYGLGEYIAQAAKVGDFPQVLIGVTVMSVYVVGLNRLVWRRLYRLAETRYSL